MGRNPDPSCSLDSQSVETIDKAVERGIGGAMAFG